MKKLLSLVLSFSLLFTSGTPLVAGVPVVNIQQILSASRAWGSVVHAQVIRRVSTLPVSLPALTAASVRSFNRLQSATALQQITQTQLSPELKQQLYLDVVPALVISSHTPITVTQHKNTLSFYRSSAEENSRKSLFPLRPETLDIWGQNMALIANLGFMGTPDDVNIILTLAEQSPVSLDVFTDITTVRALLNLGSLDGITRFAQIRAKQQRLNTGVWKDVQQFITEQQLDVSLPEIPSKGIISTQQAAERAAAALPALNKWNSLNSLQQDASAKTTLDWLNLKLHQGALVRDPQPEVPALAEDKPATSEKTQPIIYPADSQAAIEALDPSGLSASSLELADHATITALPFISTPGGQPDEILAENTSPLPQKPSVFSNAFQHMGTGIKKTATGAKRVITSFLFSPLSTFAASGLAAYALSPEIQPVAAFVGTNTILTQALSIINQYIHWKHFPKIKKSVFLTSGLTATSSALIVGLFNGMLLNEWLLLPMVAGQLILPPVLFNQIDTALWESTLNKTFATSESTAQTPGMLTRAWNSTQHYLFKLFHPKWHTYLRNLFASSPEAVSEQLAARLERNKKALQEVQQNTSEIPGSVRRGNNFPFTKLEGTLPLEWAPIFYPALAKTLTTAQQLTDYFTAQNIRHATQEIRSEYKTLSTLKASIEELKQHQKVITHPARNDVQWLVEQIPQDTNYLLLGEQHEFAPIQTIIAQLIDQLPARFPNRKIILFTEFLPQGIVYGHNFSELPSPLRLALKDYPPIWATGLKNGISSVGLEPSFFFTKPSIQPVNSIEKSTFSLWASTEGVHVRNQAWKQDLKNFRKEFPDALFVIHTGAFHIDYAIPSSLGHAFQNDKTFVIELLPGYHKSDFPKDLRKRLGLLAPSWGKDYTPGRQNFMPISSFDYVTNGEFPQRIVQFDKGYAPITGFDIQLKVPLSTKPPEDSDGMLELIQEIFGK